MRLASHRGRAASCSEITSRSVMPPKVSIVCRAAWSMRRCRGHSLPEWFSSPNGQASIRSTGLMALITSSSVMRSAGRARR